MPKQLNISKKMNEMMRKIVINASYGGFDLSPAAVELLKSLADEEICNEEDISYYYATNTFRRDDPALVQVVELLGPNASLCPGDLKVVEVPVDVQWIIQECDGAEWIAETHRTWR